MERLQSAQAPSQPELIVEKYFPTEAELEDLGAFVIENFVSAKEENELALYMDSGEWISSQSGRRKQDFGPKANFKKKKAKMGTFHGLPKIMTPIFERINAAKSFLGNYEPVECLFLEYLSENGAHIDPHFDDNWLWLRFAKESTCLI